MFTEDQTLGYMLIRENGLYGKKDLLLTDQLIGDVSDRAALTEDNDNKAFALVTAWARGRRHGMKLEVPDSMITDFRKDHEAKSAQAFQEQKASKESEAATAIKSSKENTMRAGELASTIMQAQYELGNFEVELAENEKFVASLEEPCESKEAECVKRQKLRQEEITAISEATKNPVSYTHLRAHET